MFTVKSNDVLIILHICFVSHYYSVQENGIQSHWSASIKDLQLY